MLHLPFFSEPVAFEAIPQENDELLTSIDTDATSHDDVWQLDETIDADKLDKFWSDALKDLGHGDV